MKPPIRLHALYCVAALLFGHASHAQIPQHLNHQGRVSVQGVNFTGTGLFKFALVDETNLNVTATANRMPGIPMDGIGMLFVGNPGSGYLEPPTITITDTTGTGATAEATIDNGMVTGITVTNQGSGYSPFPVVTLSAPPPDLQYFSTWSNDQTSMDGGEPNAAVSIPVVNGLYAARLGDTAAGMAAIPPGVFAGPRMLRVWFSDGTLGFQQLTPDQPLGAAPYAFRAIEAETVPDGSITYGKLGVGAVVGDRIGTQAIMAEHLNTGAVTAAKLAPGAISPQALDTGLTPPTAGQVLSFTNDGLRWVTGAAGLNFPFDSGPISLNTQTVFEIQATGPNSIAIRGRSAQGYGVYGSSGSSAYPGVYGENFSGGNGLHGIGSGNGIAVYGQGSFLSNAIGVKGHSWANDGVVGETGSAEKSGVFGSSSAGNGVTGLSEGSARSGVFGSATAADSFGGSFLNPNGVALKSFGKAEIDGWLTVRASDFWIGAADRRGTPGRAVVDWRAAPGAVTQLCLNFGDDWQETKIGGAVTEVKTLRITGGADLAEPFAMSHENVEPGSVVIIDEENPGKLRKSHTAYDKKVAGIVSGADGIQPGISMIQEDMLEAGENVALSGRVYVKANNTAGDIQPGDLLTTSAIPGEAMKASDHDRAQGAILGKAMTGLTDASGKVLVLVTLQ